MKYVDKNKNLKKLQKVELDALIYFDKICKENNLEYFLAAGTLLGAVRHKGFIPWDDDIDVHMKGSDYLKLIQILKNNNDNKYFFQSLDTDKNYYLLWNKIRVNNTLFIEKGWEDNKINNGISIDIFPLLEYPSFKDKKKIAFSFKITRLLIENNLVNNKKFKTYGIGGKILSIILRIIPQKIRNRIVINNIKYLCNYKSNNDYYYTTDTALSLKIKKDCFYKKVELEFEKYKFYAPEKYSQYLKDMYGDYMKLPDESERVGHGETYLCFDTSDDGKGK